MLVLQVVAKLAEAANAVMAQVMFVLAVLARVVLLLLVMAAIPVLARGLRWFCPSRGR